MPVGTIELGWLVIGHPDPIDLEAIDVARARAYEILNRFFPEFAWRLPLERREEPPPSLREKPIVLLEHGIVERDRRSWDFALVISASELQGREKPYTLGIPSQSVDVGVVSTARIDPVASGSELSYDERKESLSRRLLALSLHVFSHLNGLEHESDPRSWLYPVEDVSDLDRMETWPEAAVEKLRAALYRVADPRLEERPRRMGRITFYLGAIRLNWLSILSAIASARPWLFPVRLGRFGAAASSALLILLLTAEVWELGLSLSSGVAASVSVVSIAVTTIFVVSRQKLLHRGRGRRLTEQIAVTNVTVLLVVLAGLLTTYAGLLLLTLGLGSFVFPEDLVASWAAAGRHLDASRYLAHAEFIAAVGIVIGALGASFEEQDYLRHVAYVDEEI